MSATNVVTQPLHDLVHVVGDAAVYQPDGTVFRFAPKTHSISHWPGAIFGRGNSWAIETIASDLAEKFWSFDDLVGGIERELPALCETYPLSRDIELTIAGWSAARARPESHVIYSSADLPAGMSADDVKPGMIVPRAFELIPLPHAIVAPCIVDEKAAEIAGYQGINHAWPPAQVKDALRVAIELQRHAPFDIGYGEQFYCGGYATCTTIGPDTIEESILVSWPEDRVGEKLRPRPIDWNQFRKARLRVVGGHG